jgi:hypothetical protein
MGARFGALLLLATLAGAWPAHAGPVPPAAEAAELPMAAVAEPAADVADDADLRGALPGGPPLLPEEIDLLLDLQVSRFQLGIALEDPDAATTPAVPVDARGLSPGLPSNPLFPGQGLSYDLPTGPVRLAVPEASAESGGSEVVRWNGDTASWLGKAGLDASWAERFGQLRVWLVGHRTEVLLGVGVLGALLLATTGLGRLASAATSVRRHRRRRRHAESPSNSARR